ncbi:MAG: Trk family potassium uptake protein, partial [Clostridia bacterium]|nr:Trk family potassium uptake protein [Clostridia bacterium]
MKEYLQKIKIILTKIKLSRMQVIAMSFICIIAVGTILLLLPISTKPGEDTTLLGALFTATSSTCVTGLVVYDTFTHWTTFGQLVILSMIQMGGLGFITMSVFMMVIFKQKIGLGRRELIHESLGSLQIAGSVKLVRRIIFGTLIFEGAGGVLLSIRFVRDFGWLRGVYFGFFHAISAFCNAGFDLMGHREKFSSFVHYNDD